MHHTPQEIREAEHVAREQREGLAAICASCGRTRAVHSEPAICAAFVPPQRGTS